MNNSTLYYLSPIIIGVGATLNFDLWSLFTKHAFKIRPSDFCLVGRWLRFMPEGVFRHSNIASSQKKSAECTIGWATHYTVGIVFALVFIALAGKDWLQHPTLVSSLAFGLITVTMPFFIMQPAFGLGIAASKASHPAQARLCSLMNHIVFGAGLYLFGLVVSWLLGV